jgi:hypothetical protein
MLVLAVFNPAVTSDDTGVLGFTLALDLALAVVVLALVAAVLMPSNLDSFVRQFDGPYGLLEYVAISFPPAV